MHLYDVFYLNHYYKKAEMILAKLLKLCWKLKNIDMELRAYELIGRNYYYK